MNCEFTITTHVTNRRGDLYSRICTHLQARGWNRSNSQWANAIFFFISVYRLMGTNYTIIQCKMSYLFVDNIVYLQKCRQPTLLHSHINCRSKSLPWKTGLMKADCEWTLTRMKPWLCHLQALVHLLMLLFPALVSIRNCDFIEITSCCFEL